MTTLKVIGAIAGSIAAGLLVIAVLIPLGLRAAGIG
jgi:hypothetical protein